MSYASSAAATPCSTSSVPSKSQTADTAPTSRGCWPGTAARPTCTRRAIGFRSGSTLFPGGRTTTSCSGSRAGVLSSPATRSSTSVVALRSRARGYGRALRASRSSRAAAAARAAGRARAPGARSTDRPCCSRARALLTPDLDRLGRASVRKCHLSRVPSLPESRRCAPTKVDCYRKPRVGPAERAYTVSVARGPATTRWTRWLLLKMSDGNGREIRRRDAGSWRKRCTVGNIAVVEVVPDSQPARGWNEHQT